VGLQNALAHLLARLPRSRHASATSTTDPALRRLIDNGYWILTKLKDEPNKIGFFDYFENGDHIWPIFSSQESATRFFAREIARDQIRAGEIVSCPVLQLKIGSLLANDHSRSRILLDPKLESEREVTQKDLQTIRALAGSTIL
jgi:hypothetical protein